MSAAIGIVLPTRYTAPLREYVDLVTRADQLGFDTAWFTEIADADAFALASAAAMATRRISLATGVIPISTRTVPLMAMAATTLSDLSAGRAILGLGMSTAAILGRWHGLGADAMLARLGETVAALRAAFGGVDFEGHYLRSSGFRLPPRSNPDPPIYLAALGPRAVALAADRGDGVILTLSTQDHLASIARTLGDPAGRKVPLVAYVRVAVGRQAETTREWMRSELAWYSSSPAYRAHFRSQGFTSEMDAAEAEWKAGRGRFAAAAITDEMCDRLSVTGTPTEVREQIARLHAAGVDEVACYFIDAEREGVVGMVDQLEQLADG